MLNYTAFKIDPPVIAHRGASAYAPENTLPAFLKAKECGARWVEFDVQMTQDGQLVVFHDHDLLRIARCPGTIQDSTLPYLKSLDVGAWFSPEFRGVTMPTLREVLEFLQLHQMAANIEIKPQNGNGDAIAEKIMQELTWLAKDPIPFFISSFDASILVAIKKKDPTLPVAHLMHHWSDQWQLLCDQLNCVAVDVNCEEIDKKKVSDILATNRLALIYTVNDARLANTLFSWNVSGVFSDYPDKIIRELACSMF